MLAAEIAADGPVICARELIKDHPALKHELANCAFVVRALHRLARQDRVARRAGVMPRFWRGRLESLSAACEAARH
jgi:hypothetical protein